MRRKVCECGGILKILALLRTFCGFRRYGFNSYSYSIDFLVRCEKYFVDDFDFDFDIEEMLLKWKLFQKTLINIYFGIELPPIEKNQSQKTYYGMAPSKRGFRQPS